MKQRERLLAIACGGFALLLVGYWIWSTTSSMFAARQKTLRDVQRQRQEQEQLIQRSARAKRELNTLQKRSLPANSAQARSAYQQWLLQLVERSGFAKPAVRTPDQRARSKYFEQHRFEVEGEANLSQVVEFLVGFYQADDLHRIRSLTLTPPGNDQRLTVRVVIEALALADSKRTTVGDLVVTDRTAEKMQTVRAAIESRSMFLPPNLPPTWEPIAKQQIVRGEPWRFTARANDPNFNDLCQFELVEGAPESLKLEPKETNETDLVWTPTANGEFTVKLRAKDNGLPSQSAEATITIAVTDPPPRADANASAGFDHGKQTFLVAMLGNGEARQAWFDVRTQGRLVRVHEGDPLQIGTFRAKVTKIADDFVELQVDQQRPLHLRIGQSLDAATPVETAAVQSQPAPTTDRATTPAQSQ